MSPPSHRGHASDWLALGRLTACSRMSREPACRVYYVLRRPPRFRGDVRQKPSTRTSYVYKRHVRVKFIKCICVTTRDACANFFFPGNTHDASCKRAAGENKIPRYAHRRYNKCRSTPQNDTIRVGTPRHTAAHRAEDDGTGTITPVIFISNSRTIRFTRGPARRIRASDANGGALRVA